jgi:hypothetical protein
MTLSRRELYDSVWSKPLEDLAEEFGISQSALIKRCGEVNVPTPPNGYWAASAEERARQRQPFPVGRSKSVPNTKSMTDSAAGALPIGRGASDPSDATERNNPESREPAVNTFHLGAG